MDPALDPRALDELRAIDPDDADGLITEVLETFCEDSSNRGRELARALEAGDLTRVQETAHALKGSSRTVGAFTLAAHCERLETLSDGAAEGVRVVRTELDRVLAEARRMLADLGR